MNSEGSISMSESEPRPGTPRKGSGTTERVIEDAVMGPAETALEDAGERPAQSAAETLGGKAADAADPNDQATPRR